MKTFYGLVVCGGKSSRMGIDKSLLEYHGLPQRYYLYKTLLPFCEKVFLSVNRQQEAEAPEAFSFLEDLPVYEEIGPMAALLTAFSRYPDKNFLVVGCDYPFLTSEDIDHFLQSISKESIAAAFYNEAKRYEPLLAWYSSACGPVLEKYFEQQEYSLQRILVSQNAEKYQPKDQQIMQSVDTYADFQRVNMLFKK